MINENLLNKIPQSYWLESTGRTNYPTLNEDIDVDVLIIGGGMVGLLTAYQLKGQVAKLTIIEAERIVESTTAHTTAKITSQHGLIYHKLISKLGRNLAEQYAQANELAIGHIKEIIDENKIDCDFETQAAYIYTQDEKYLKQIQAEVEAAQSLGIQAEFVDEIPFPMEVRAGMVFKNQAQFHPRKFLLDLAQIVHKNGVQIYEKTRAIELEEGYKRYVITTDKGSRILADKVIIASQYPFYNKKSMYYGRIYVERSYILAVKAKEDYPGGMYINAEDPPRSLRSLPTEDGELILVVGENHKPGQSEDTNGHYLNLLNFAQDLFTVEAVPYRWSTQDCLTLDGIPYVGQYASDTPNLYVATGFGKWGMTNSMVSSMILSDLINEGKSPFAEVYDPSRKTIAASAKNFLIQNADVAVQLIEGKLSSTEKDVSLKPGEAIIIEIDGEKVGTFKDEEGELHLINITCTHMGCELKWNKAERSWDCPCHGSRFTYDGDIIQGPAVKPLSFDRDVNTIKKLINENF
ncbi:MAG: FAD-dependent oxidoreductase [Tissierellaceae bacterium]